MAAAVAAAAALPPHALQLLGVPTGSSSRCRPHSIPAPLGPCLEQQPRKAREIIASVLRAKLAAQEYSSDRMSVLAREAADEIRQRIKGQGWPRYKFCVQVLIGEQRGEGCRMSSRCFWHAETDQYAFESFQNETMFSTAAVFAAYVY